MAGARRRPSRAVVPPAPRLHGAAAVARCPGCGRASRTLRQGAERAHAADGAPATSPRCADARRGSGPADDRASCRVRPRRIASRVPVGPRGRGGRSPGGVRGHAPHSRNARGGRRDRPAADLAGRDGPPGPDGHHARPRADARDRREPRGRHRCAADGARARRTAHPPDVPADHCRGLPRPGHGRAAAGPARSRPSRRSPRHRDAGRAKFRSVHLPRARRHGDVLRSIRRRVDPVASRAPGVGRARTRSRRHGAGRRVGRGPGHPAGSDPGRRGGVHPAVDRRSAEVARRDRRRGRHCRRAGDRRRRRRPVGVLS